MGIAYKNTKRNAEALRCFFDALELGYEHNDCYCAIGVILRDKGEYELAESYFNKALKQDSEYTNALIERATAYFYSGQKEKALEDVNFLISKNPDDSRFYLLRAILYRSFGMQGELMKEIEKAREVYDNLGKEKNMKLNKEQKPKTYETAH
ncbi:MAG: tetratricopeptide repeat protein [Candidatus Kapaibacterium sp.]